jgi:hypothetical protein
VLHRCVPPIASLQWLVLMFQLPARPTAARVRTWRQLQRLGALSVRNSGYFLPSSDQAREDFEWLRADIVSSGGAAMLLRAETLDAAAEAELVGAFRDARRVELQRIRRDAVAARRRPVGDARAARELAERLAALEAADYFGGVDAARRSARAAVAALQPERGGVMKATADAGSAKAADFMGRTWVTRPRPGIDRFASAWLITRFIDPRARFAFADSADAGARRPRAVTFDMYGGDFGHQAGGCTFETLVARFGLHAPGIVWLAALVHALDLKVEADAIPESAAVARMVEGLREMYSDDPTLLQRGMEMIEALYRSRLPQEAAVPARVPAKDGAREGPAPRRRGRHGRR